MLSLLCKGYYIEIIVFWRRVGGPGKARKATALLGIFRSRQGFPSRDRVSGPMSR